MKGAKKMRKFFFLILILASSRQSFAADLPEKPYLPNQNELAFPKEAVQNCFGIKRTAANIIQVEQSHGHINFAKSYINQPMHMGERTFAHGIGVHANSNVLVQLPKPGVRFKAVVGLNQSYQTKGFAQYKVIFSVESRGRILWQSVPLGIDDQSVPVDVPLNGATELNLKVKSAAVRVHLCHADWGDAQVEYKKKEKAWLEEYAAKAAIFNSTPFSFAMGRESSRDFLSTWTFTYTDSAANDRLIHTTKWQKPDGTFEVRCQVVEFLTHPAVEWQLFFKNTGDQNSPVLEKVRPLDVSIDESVMHFPNQSPRQPAMLYCNRGSNNANSDFMPLKEMIDPEQTYRLKSNAGRSSETYLPFWNLQFHGHGLVTALGWSGDWDAEFLYPKSNQMVMKAGMTNMQLYLKPGEEISSPSVCLLYWEGKEPLRGNNLFRRYMREMVSPKWNGKEPISLAMLGGSSALETVNERNQLDFIQKIAGSGAEVYWLDAGWYDGPVGATWDVGRGNWYPDPRKFPNGMKPLADAAHRNGQKFLLWFDPEVVAPGTQIAREHPDWVIRQNATEPGLYNLGNPAALKYMTDLISDNLIKWGVDVYRNDFNIDPGPKWKLAGEPGRIGMTEIRYVEGLYKFWDELLRRKPDLLIDNCASGGRRIDYETCKRSVPLWRSDYECAPAPDLYEAGQNQTFGLAYYLPFNSTGYGVSFDRYKDRSFATCSVIFSINSASPNELAVVPFDDVKSLWNDIKSYHYLMLGDFYPLTEFSLSDQVWMVLQFDSPERGEGCVLCFRRPNAPFTEAELSLKAIDPQATYKVVYLDSGKETITKGEQLHSLAVRLNRGESAVIKYEKK